MGTAFVYPNLHYIETWPDIFVEGKLIRVMNWIFQIFKSQSIFC